MGYYSKIAGCCNRCKYFELRRVNSDGVDFFFCHNKKRKSNYIDNNKEEDGKCKLRKKMWLGKKHFQDWE